MLQRHKPALVRMALAGLLVAGAPAAYAAPGDVHRVTAETVNLRAGPSDQTNVRGRIQGGEQVLELTREGNWYGVRVLRTGEVGWIFGDLLQLAAASALGQANGPVEPESAGFRELSSGFDQMMQAINRELGMSVFDRVEPVQGDRLKVRAHPDWLRATSRDAHLMAATAIYEMWKNHQNSAPVQVVLTDGDDDYVTIADEATGPRLTVASLGEG
ncbi:MAG TPA: SH3 domain-containing protein [Geminicoccaceae bacterium]|nr:SH3 domain-containing protein [Geminicoccaceae bacterium]